jgi:hypothetical protein
MTTKTQSGPNKEERFLLAIGATLLGAAAGANFLDKLVGGSSFPRFLSLAGGAILGAVGAHSVARSLLSEE